MAGSMKGTRTAPRNTNSSTIAMRRKALGITQAQLAERIGRTQNDVSRWERGLFKPSARALIALAQVLNCSIEDLMDEQERQ